DCGKGGHGGCGMNGEKQAGGCGKGGHGGCGRHGEKQAGSCGKGGHGGCGMNGEKQAGGCGKQAVQVGNKEGAKTNAPKSAKPCAEAPTEK
ncbi:MAG: hypothetical protein IKS20_15185, partial [Victivallales bacterium]|nr:hypothetical protein [Victivallales bacterium]